MSHTLASCAQPLFRLEWPLSLHASKESFGMVTKAGGGLGTAPGDDATLMAAAIQGDVSAYRELVNRHVRGIHAFVYRMLGSRAEAEEVCQESFLRLWTSGKTYGARAKPSTWLYRVAHNLAVDRLRRRREAASEQIDEAPASGRPSLHLYDKQLAEAVQRALDQLPERQRAAISLVHYQGMSSAEAAEVLGIKLRALESLLARGRRQLRELLEPFQKEGSGE